MSHPPITMPAMFCEHANESPLWCQCLRECYCRLPGNSCDRTTGNSNRTASAEASSLRRPTPDQKFAAFHEANPHVYAELVRLAREAKASGRLRVGSKELFEVARWHLRLKTRGSEFRLDNSMTSLYARLIQDQEPDLRGMFEVRRRRTK